MILLRLEVMKEYNDLLYCIIYDTFGQEWLMFINLKWLQLSVVRERKKE